MALKIHKDNGFTLIELLVVIAVLVTVVGLGLASFNGFNRRERLKQTALTMKSHLRFAQTKAISADKPASGCTTLVGMQVSFTVSSYSVGHQCSPEGAAGDTLTITFPSDVTFASIPSNFMFLTLTNRVNITSAVTITLTNGVQSYAIVVGPNGNVSDQGFL